MSTKPLPRHLVSIIFNEKTNTYGVHCTVCGQLGSYNSWEKANNRRLTHYRGQDAGKD